MEVSCGLVIVNDQDELFLAHVTGAAHWSLPKGLPKEEGETRLATVLRETLEETSLSFRGEDLLDLGEHPYRPSKRLHLFAIKVLRESIRPEACLCTSYFTHSSGKELPEVDRFAWVPFSQLDEFCVPRMSTVLRLVRAEALAGYLLPRTPN